MSQLITFIILAVYLSTVTGFIPTPVRSICTPRTLKMTILNRFVGVIKSNVNSLLTQTEDPGKVTDKVLIDLQQDLVQSRQLYSEISTSRDIINRQKEQAVNKANDLFQCAQIALQKNDEEVAREALSRRLTQTTLAEDLEKKLVSQYDELSNLSNSITLLESMIVDTVIQKGQSLVSDDTTTNTLQQVNDMLNIVKPGTNSVEVKVEVTYKKTF